MVGHHLAGVVLWGSCIFLPSFRSSAQLEPKTTRINWCFLHHTGLFGETAIYLWFVGVPGTMTYWTESSHHFVFPLGCSLYNTIFTTSQMLSTSQRHAEIIILDGWKIMENYSIFEAWPLVIHPWCPTCYPLVICYIAIENTPFIVDLPIQNGDFP